MRRRLAPPIPRASNCSCYALGKPVRNGFHVRKIVWGKLLASYERRPDEEIRQALISVAPSKVRPLSTTPTGSND